MTDDIVQHKAANKGASKPRLPDREQVIIIRLKIVNRDAKYRRERLTLGRCSGFFLSMPLISVFLHA